MKKGIVLILAFAVLVFTASAQQQNLLPVLYGNILENNESADGATVTVYPQGNEGDSVTDTVGEGGNANLSGFYKINLNNLQTDLNNGDKVVVHAEKDGKEALVVHEVDTSKGINLVDLELEEPNQVQNELIANIQIYQGWTLFGLPFNPKEANNTEQLGQLIMQEANVSCEVVMKFDGSTQLWVDDILGFEDPELLLSSQESYFVHCDGESNFAYEGTVWE